MKPIYLVGFMGCGKTTVGKELAKRLNLMFIDLDEEIVIHTGKSIPEIFKEFGEKGFRDIESNVLKKVSSDGVVISTGGGIITQNENIEFMKERGLMFYLASSIEILYERIRFDSNRPNAFDRSLEDLKSLFESRKPQYEKANYEIVTENLTPSDVCMEIINCLNYVKGGDSSNK